MQEITHHAVFNIVTKFTIGDISEIIMHLSFVSTTPGRAGRPRGIWHFEFFSVKFPTHKLDLVVKYPYHGGTI
jgi:hypothetical protein